MNLLELIQQTCDELLIPSPSAVVGTQDPQIKQLYALLNRFGVDLVRQYEWEQLDREHLLTTVAINSSGDTVNGSNVITNIPDTSGITTSFSVNGPGTVPFAQVTSVSSNSVTLNMPMTETQTAASFQFSQVDYPLPSDWQREIPQTEWDRTNRWPLVGPVSPQDWQSFKSGIVYAGPRERFRILREKISINPPPPNGLIFALEYISNAWVESVSGALQTKYLADTDSSFFPDSLLISGLKAKWKQAKGLDYSFEVGEFSSILEESKSQNKSAAKLSLSPYPYEILLSPFNIPDGNWNL